MLRTAMASLVLVTVTHAGVPLPSCTDPVLPCPIGWIAAEEQHSDQYGTPPGSCSTCTSAPGTPGCVEADWTTQAPIPSAPQLAIPKFVPPAGLAQLTTVELVIRSSACGVVGIENTDPVNGCINVATQMTELTFSAVPGQGLEPLLAQLSQPLLTVQFTSAPLALSAYDGTTDSGGTSGVTITFPLITSETCIRITDPAQLALFVDDGNGPGMLFFDHAATSSSSSSGCAPQTFTSSAFAGLELEVRYRTCVALDTTFCFGSNATCPCGNGGAVDAGCDNAHSTGGVRLTASGDPGLNTVVLHGTGFPASTSPTVVALRASALEPSPVLLGDGLLCLSSTGGSGRFGAARASGGTSTHALDHTAGPGTFSYQLWYRSEPASFCNAAAAFNTSSAISIDWP